MLRSSPCAGVELARQQQLAGGEVHADLQAEAATRLGGDVHADIAFLKQLAQRLAADAVDHLQQVVVVLGGDQHLLAVRARAPIEIARGGMTQRPHVGEQRVADGRGDRPPQLAARRARRPSARARS